MVHCWPKETVKGEKKKEKEKEWLKQIHKAIPHQYKTHKGNPCSSK